MATEQEGHTPWGVEQTENMLWIGPMRPDGCKVDQVVFGLNFDRDLTAFAKLSQLSRARLIAAAPDLLKAGESARQALWSALDHLGFECPDEHPAIVELDAAIARATGEA
ncbi:hypothetical protein [Sphingopyxis terrae]|uniref:hypothetical protein n=1 Tax=Sphingopyxis terrae TaxID=33052 RepID=UPI0007885C34|nr:hypothetical protein [Sphingopyxis terrae]